MYIIVTANEIFRLYRIHREQNKRRQRPEDRRAGEQNRGRRRRAVRDRRRGKRILPKNSAVRDSDQLHGRSDVAKVHPRDFR